MVTRLLLVALGVVVATAAPSAQSDLDEFMGRVLARRDANWKKLQQYVLEERETFRVDGLTGSRLYGFDREYLWYIRDGVFIRSPVKADGVTIDEDERRQEENRWLRRERSREARRSARGLDGLEPRFVSSAYFLEFKFDPGQYALAGREQLDGREVLRIEYYPTKLFTDGRTRPNRRLREREPDVQDKMNKVALVTLWVDPAEHQILQYEFRNIDMDFLPGRAFARVDGLEASMRMGEPFPGVWLPRSVQMQFQGTLATGSVSGAYDVEYFNYKLADVTVTVR
jgi:hypothetical protein